MPETTRRGTVYPSRAAAADQDRKLALRVLSVLGNTVIYAAFLACVAVLIYPPLLGWFM